jgi:hypothetical protein
MSTRTKKAAEPEAQAETVAPAEPDPRIGQVTGGERMVLRDPVTHEQVAVGREADPRDVVGLSYGKHSKSARTEEGDEQPIVVVHPVRVDGRNRRSDDDVIEGGPCEITEGDLEGVDGVFWLVARYDPQTGYPVQVIVRTADDQNEYVSVPYDSIRPRKSLR